MRKIREVLRLTHELGMRRQVREATGVGKTAVCEYVTARRSPESGGRSRTGSAMPSWSGGCLRRRPRRRGARCRTGHGPCGAQAARGDADDAVAGVSLPSRPRLRLQLVLRALRRMAKAPLADDAADARGGRQAVRRLGGRHGRRHRCDDGRGASGRIFVAVLGRVELTPTPRRAGARRCRTGSVRMSTRSASSAACRRRGARQSQGRHHQAVALRAGHQPDLSGPRRSLRLRRAAGAHPKPRDKAKVEAAVAIVSRFVLGRLRNRRFFSLVELNDAVRDCVTKINAKVMKQLGRAATIC